MKILVIGNGCREHALVKNLQQDLKVDKVFTLPQRVSLQGVESLDASFLKDQEALSQKILEEKIDLVVVGPEQPLVNGLSDFLREKNIKVFGPSKAAAQLEGSKVFSKTFMKENQIPTASYQIVSNVSDVLRESENFFPPYVLKADGLAGGKGVFICKTLQELEEKSQLLFEKKSLGSAGDTGILEDFQSGEEMSVFIVTNGVDYDILPVAKDYKRLNEGQTGPNTGGMGAIAPIQVPVELMNQIRTSVIEPTLKGLQKRGTPYSGVLYIGLMVHKGIPKVLEYNVRFGDPEAQVLLPLLENSWAQVFLDIALGKRPKFKWSKKHFACVVLASEGYPDNPIKNVMIEGSIDCEDVDSYFLHGSLAQRDQDHNWVTNGGRVLNSIASSDSRSDAIEKAYKHLSKVSWAGMQYRKDIGK